MEMGIREVDIEKLEPAPYNPRAISDEALDGLSHSIGEFGLVEPIVWNERTGHECSVGQAPPRTEPP
jgi:ParB-like chromosome segregation protein Spo0J